MRIGTWNLAGRWTRAHRDLLTRTSCDVWLLTEVHGDVALEGYEGHMTDALMAEPSRRWAGVLTRLPLEPLDDPHPATAAVRIDGATYCSSVLPWRACGSQAPWSGERHVDRFAATLDALSAWMPSRDLVWGGDWNQSLEGRDYSGSRAGRAMIEDLLCSLSLTVPTAALPHRLEGIRSIDHIAVNREVPVASAERWDATGLSDHDLYVVVH